MQNCPDLKAHTRAPVRRVNVTRSAFVQFVPGALQFAIQSNLSGTCADMSGTCADMPA